MKDKFQALLEVFEGTPAEATLREMADELGEANAFELVSLIINRADVLAQLWLDEGAGPATTGEDSP